MSDVSTQPDPSRIGNRYTVLGRLGRGGMAAVYRVRDETSGEELALKCLMGKEGEALPEASVVELFEREFHTLNQLAHPRVVRAFDYGIEDGRPFYTLELLDGGDLRAQAPLPWQQVCTMAYELCSVLSLLHSRKLVHRDLTPRNVRLTRDGRAKLIDFGLLSPIGPVQLLAGTPPYLAPEVVNSMRVDGRADLFALGATLYYALTGKVAYPAHKLGELRDAWRGTPARIAVLAPEVPAALERLVTGLLRLDVDSRPRSAPEVMDLLRPLLQRPPDEELVVAQAHLSAPTLVGRQTEQTHFRKQLLRARSGRGGGFLIVGAAGTGRSRMLDVFVLEAKLLGGVVARASGSGDAAGPFGVAHALAAQLHASAPLESLAVARQDPSIWRTLFGHNQALGTDAETDERAEPSVGAATRTLRDFGSAQRNAGQEGGQDAAAQQAALRAWILGLARRRPVALAIDDLESADAQSTALLAALAVEAPQTQLSYATSATADTHAGTGSALEVLAERARRITLAPLQPEQTALLLRSVFGDVPNLQSAALQLHGLSGGRPRECMALAQHLVDRGLIRHDRGAWMLPPLLEADALPSSMEEALAQQIERLSPAATEVARLLSLSVVGRLGWSELNELIAGDRATLRDALDDLRQADVLTGGPDGYVGHAAATPILLERCPPEEKRRLHSALAAMHARFDAAPLVITHHLLQGRDPDQGIRLLLSHMVTDQRGRQYMATGVSTVGLSACAETIRLTHSLAVQRGYPPGDLLTLALFMEVSATHGADLKYYNEVASWVEVVLKRATGFDDWLALSSVNDPRARAQQAVALASERHQHASESERVKAPADAISWMVKHALQAMVIGLRANDLELQASLPDLLAPFAPLSPAVDAMRRNIMANHLLALGATEAARDLLLELEDDLAAFDLAALPEIVYVRPSVRLKAILIEVIGGFGDAPASGTEDTDVSSLQANIEGVRRLAALQRGDWAAAEMHRTKTELMVLESGAPGMFNWIEMEWPIHAMLRDLTGIRAIRERLAPLAERHPGWVPARLAVDAWYHRLCEQPEAALAAVDALREVVGRKAITPQAFYRAVEVEVAMLVQVGEPERALEQGLTALNACRADGRRMLAHGIALEVALAEAALGDQQAARSRVEDEIAWQQELGVRGLLLGLSYEYLARLALLSGDRPALEAAVTRVAHEYRADAGSMLTVRYSMLLEEAQRAGMDINVLVGARLDSETAEHNSALDLLSDLSSSGEAGVLVQEGLRLLCDAHGATAGWLYLLSEQGLSLSAAQGEGETQARVTAFAQAHCDLERDDGTLTFSAAEGRDAGEAFAAAVAGAATGSTSRRLQAVPLLAKAEGHDTMVGIAVLAIGDEPCPPSHRVVRLASGLGKCLLELRRASSWPAVAGSP